MRSPTGLTASAVEYALATIPSSTLTPTGPREPSVPIKVGALERLADLAMALGGAQEPRVVYRALYDFVRGSARCDWLAVSLVDLTSDERRCVFLAGAGQEIDTSVMPIRVASAPGPHGLAIKTGRPVVVNDLATDLATHESTPVAGDVNPEEPQSSLVVPMIAHGRVIGGFEIQSSEVNAYAEDDVALLVMAGNLAAIATENVQLLESERRERRNAQAAAQRFSGLVQNLDAVVWEAHAEDHHLTFISERVASMLGYPPEQWLAQPDLWRERIHSGDRDEVLAKSAQALAKGNDYELQYRLLAADGHTVWVSDVVNIGPDGDDRRAVLAGVMIDITERKRLEEEFLQAQKMESVGRLAGGVAHDFNNLLTAIGGYGEMLAFSELNPAQRSDLGEIQKATERATVLTRRLLAFSRRQVLERKTVDLNDLVQGLEGMLRPIIGEHISLRTDLDPALGVARLDPAQIEQIVLNLVVNSRDAMPDGGVITITTANADAPAGTINGPCVVLRVSDTGAGMSAETRAHIFEPFFTTKEAGKGTGLGLATVYGIAVQMGGHIVVESVLDEGTTFSIFFPRTDEPLESAPAPAPTQALPRGQETILLVEDEPLVRELLTHVLARQGYRVLVASDGPTGLDLAEHHEGPLDLVVSDVIMPGLLGTHMVERLRQDRPGLKALFTSGFSDEQDGESDAGRQADEHLLKPFSPELLVRRVRAILDRPPRD